MKNRFVLLLLVLLLSVTAQAQSDWVNQKIDGKISVKFPASPQKQSVNGIDNYIVKQADSVAYAVSVLDFKKMANLDSAALAPMKDQQGFADQLISGMASQKKNYTFGKVSLGKWNDFTTYSVNATDAANKYTLDLKMIIIGSKMYTLSCRVPDSLTSKPNETFIKSVEILK